MGAQQTSSFLPTKTRVPGGGGGVAGLFPSTSAFPPHSTSRFTPGQHDASAVHIPPTHLIPSLRILDHPIHRLSGSARLVYCCTEYLYLPTFALFFISLITSWPRELFAADGRQLSHLASHNPCHLGCLAQYQALYPYSLCTLPARVCSISRHTPGLYSVSVLRTLCFVSVLALVWCLALGSLRMDAGLRVEWILSPLALPVSGMIKPSLLLSMDGRPHKMPGYQVALLINLRIPHHRLTERPQTSHTHGSQIQTTSPLLQVQGG